MVMREAGDGPRLDKRAWSPRSFGRKKLLAALVLIGLCYAAFDSWPLRAPAQAAAPAPLIDSRLELESVFGSKNPVWQTQAIVEDAALTLESISSPVRAGQIVHLVFRCSHPDENNLCPDSYRIQLVGPTLVSTAYNNATRLQRDLIQVELLVPDPGIYKLYAWPERETCEQFKGMEIPYFKQMVSNMPKRLVVQGPPQLAESAAMCPSIKANQDLPGRWISRAYLQKTARTPSSPHFGWLSTHLTVPDPDPDMPTRPDPAYLYAPHSCKRPFHTHRDWLDIVRPAHLLVFGDSVLRNSFCAHIWAEAGGPNDGSCQNSNDELYRLSTKTMTYSYPDGSSGVLSFVWSPNGKIRDLQPYFDGLRAKKTVAPSHIVFSNALWLANTKHEDYMAAMERTFAILKTNAPSAMIFARDSMSTVEAIDCYDRIGGKRKHIERMNAGLRELVNKHAAAGMDVRFVHAYDISDARPETTSDGRHWASTRIGHISPAARERPEQGMADRAVWNIIWYDMLFPA